MSCSTAVKYTTAPRVHWTANNYKIGTYFNVVNGEASKAQRAGNVSMIVLRKIHKTIAHKTGGQCFLGK
jgi:hypothetical protein